MAVEPLASYAEKLKLRRCACGCGGDYPEECFRGVIDASITRMGKSAISIMCEQNARDEEKYENRWVVKARDTIRRHAEKYGLSSDEFCKRFDWKVERIAHEMEHAYTNGCVKCGRPYQEMEHGISDVTIDIVDRDLPPMYGSNTRIICMTCNRAKSKTPHRIYVIRELGWRLWKENNKKRTANIYHGLPLLEPLARPLKD